jgi:MazG family protein
MTRPERSRALAEFGRLLDIIARLRAPGGCEWDRKQTSLSMRPHLLDEAREVVEAIDKGDPLHVCEELGDLTMNVVFQAQLADEDGVFTMADVLQGIGDKLVARHPHVFSEETRGLSPDQVLEQWGELKKQEKIERSRISQRMEAAGRFPSALQAAAQTQNEAARVGFDFPHAESVLGKIAEEAEEIRQALAQGGRSGVEDEVGDLLFSIVNVARYLEVNPEMALRSATAKFVTRFRLLEERIERQGGWQGKTIEDMDAIWNEVKSSLRSG